MIYPELEQFLQSITENVEEAMHLFYVGLQMDLDFCLPKTTNQLN